MMDGLENYERGLEEIVWEIWQAQLRDIIPISHMYNVYCTHVYCIMLTCIL